MIKHSKNNFNIKNFIKNLNKLHNIAKIATVKAQDLHKIAKSDIFLNLISMNKKLARKCYIFNLFLKEYLHEIDNSQKKK